MDEISLHKMLMVNFFKKVLRDGICFHTCAEQQSGEWLVKMACLSKTSHLQKNVLALQMFEDVYKNDFCSQIQRLPVNYKDSLLYDLS